LITGDVADAGLQQRLGHREDAFAVKNLARPEAQCLDFLPEGAFGHKKANHTVRGGWARPAARAGVGSRGVLSPARRMTRVGAQGLAPSAARDAAVLRCRSDRSEDSSRTRHDVPVILPGLTHTTTSMALQPRPLLIGGEWIV